MFVVVLTDLARPLEDEAVALAADMGTTPYDARIALNGGLPTILLTTIERDRAARVLEGIERRGNGAMVVDSDTVVPNAEMTALRRFRFEPGAVMADERPDVSLPYKEVFALLRASHRVITETRTETSRSQFSAARTIATGGLATSRKVKTETTSNLEEKEQVLYLFRRGGETPWILREMSTNYSGLGSALGHSRAQNFGHTVRMLRAQMPMAAYDERLLAAKRIPQHIAIRGTLEGGRSTSASSDAGVDLLAHILGIWHARATGAAYRT